MTNEQDGLAEVIAFPGTKAASGDRTDHLARLRAQLQEAEQRGEAPRAEEDQNREAAPVSKLRFAPTSSGNISRMPGVNEHDPAAVDDASDLLVRALSRSGKSVREAESFLAERTELGSREREQIVKRMIDLGYLDDSRLAEQLVAGTLSRKGLGRGGMSRELRKRGLDDGIVQEVLAGFDGDDEFERALDLARERASRFRGLDYETAQRRLYGYLARRGFAGDIVGRAVKEALA